MRVRDQPWPPVHGEPGCRRGHRWPTAQGVVCVHIRARHPFHGPSLAPPPSSRAADPPAPSASSRCRDMHVRAARAEHVVGGCRRAGVEVHRAARLAVGAGAAGEDRGGCRRMETSTVICPVLKRETVHMHSHDTPTTVRALPAVAAFEWDRVTDGVLGRGIWSITVSLVACSTTWIVRPWLAWCAGVASALETARSRRAWRARLESSAEERLPHWSLLSIGAVRRVCSPFRRLSTHALAAREGLCTVARMSLDRRIANYLIDMDGVLVREEHEQPHRPLHGPAERPDMAAARAHEQPLYTPRMSRRDSRQAVQVPEGARRWRRRASSPSSVREAART